MEYLRGLFGIFFIIAIGYLFSSNRKAISWKLVLGGIGIQLVVGLLIGKVAIAREAFDYIGQIIVKFFSFSQKGAEFLYGDLSKNSLSDTSAKHGLGFLFAFQALPIVIFFSAVSAGLYYLGVLQKIVVAFAWIMSKTMRLSGSESLSASANILLGQTEAPMLVRPFISTMTISELNCIMVGGMATIAGSVMGAYISFLGGGDMAQQSKYASYLLCASIMNAPAAIVLAKIIVPETQPEKINKNLVVTKDQIGVNIIDAIARGASDGLKLALNVAAMLLAFIAIIYTINWVLTDFVGVYTGLNEVIKTSSNGMYKALSMQYILGQLFRGVAFCIGVPWSESLYVGSLLGQKMVINEFIAYLDLASMKNAGILSEKSIRIATFALCGFANFGSVAIQLGGIGGMAPDRQKDLAKLGLKAMVAGTLATMLSAAIAGALF